ncbi:uncharacterized protein TrAtP1_004554 [Trichoderma atroviride]|uniref:uncharacterized protein n=1 Tax=Hypocrea atroviridis TaxID=63577 RepID=UPI003321A35E|nr:hypothetical protein TrAtP1_004554 [Trichoderma atroviride]
MASLFSLASHARAQWPATAKHFCVPCDLVSSSPHQTCVVRLTPFICVITPSYYNHYLQAAVKHGNAMVTEKKGLPL